MAGAAFADAALVYDGGGKFDKSFNEAAYMGAEKFKAEGGAYQDLEISGDAMREQAVRQFAARGNNPIVLPGFSWETALRAVAPEFPDTKFTIIDTVVDLPNVQSVVFKEQEGSYLVGILAAMKSESGKIGVVPAFNFTLLEAFACGYAQGAKSVNPDIEVLETYVGTGFEAFNDPVKATEVAKSQLDQGVDVIFQVSGGSGAGVLQAAADAGKYGIGVDSNQNHLHPGSVLTSMLKRVDVAAYNAMKGVEDGTWAPGTIVLGLAEEGVGAAIDEHNAELITPEMQAALDKATADIISGAVTVHDYRSDESCPSL
ncbi:BMP family ABC transporter substrate-binding protein [Devosia sp. XJ19-1]|uniref:BMP family ABC transporter substrate-binding protein n=2 Tax=Devosia ureilytica TaxID=2952754 RepID=A0A9Q4AS06_9HYPH|nr:BMP family ABC transporter substrate-binding protein [Devosia ureilytica]MCP8885273.1 BMP family ABC transporter substrate-binding protein [Devosia ureilytica]MCP8888731.1 BMP family ABC transporter substrate-binding protein [Devosia ureilytica]